MKKILSLVLSIALMCTMSVLPAFAEGDVVELEVFRSASRPMNEATELTRQYIEDAIGVNFNMVQGDGSTFTQQLALRVTDGDMPEMVHTSYTIWGDYADQGAWADLAPYLNEEDYPNLMKYVGDNWPFVTTDGAIYGVPSIGDNNTSHSIFIRQDWLDKLNLKMPTTLDELTEVMRAFTFNDPDGDGQNNTYGLSGAGATYLSFLMGAFGSSSARDFFLNEDGTITDNAISEEYKASLAYLRDIYAEGLVDPEMFTCTYEQAVAKWGRGEMGIWAAWWSHAGNAYSRFEFGTLQPDAVIEVLPLPVGPTGLSGALDADPVSAVIGVSYECSEEEIKAALRLLDFCASDLGFRVCMYGVPGEFFEYDEETNQTTWTWGINGNKSKSGKYEITDMEVYKLLGREKVQAQVHELSDDVANRMYVKGSNVRWMAPSRNDEFGLFATAETIEYKSELDTYFNTNMLAFIMGEKDIEADWDAYVAEYLSMGGDVTRQSQLELFNQTYGTNATFLK